MIQYISHQYQYLLYCNSSQYILSTYNSQHNNNNVVLAMTMSYSGIVIANTTLLYTKLEKNMIVWGKIVIVHTKYPQKIRPSLHSTQFFLSAPPAPNLKSWIRP